MITLPIHYAEVQQLYAGTIDRGLRTVAVTSAEPGEGVSTIAYALARRAAAAGERTLLVELNLFRPALVEGLGLAPKPAWTVKGESSFAAMTEFPSIGMTVLPAPVGVSSNELLRFADRRQMADLVMSWREKFDVVICDCSAVNRSNKGNIAMTGLSEAGCTPLMVVLSCRTSGRAVQRAVNTITEAGMIVGGTVLNKRFDPSLYQEFKREADKIERYAPRAAKWLRQFSDQNRKFLSS